MIGGDTAALLIRKVDYVSGWMKTIIAGTEVHLLLNLEGRVRSQMACGFIEPELIDHVWP